jgi:Holliday junction DNA helicase RuvA
VYCSKRTIGELSPGQDLQLWIEHIIRAESQTLCGFLTYEEQLLFREVTSVQGVGAKVGLAILSAMSSKDIVHAVINQDKRAFTASDGVGAKMAERIVIELKNSKVIKTFNVSVGTQTGDAVAALVALGYERGAAYRAVSELLMENCSAEELIRAALLRLSGAN